MNVASLELCKDLYELSGWHKPEYFYATNDLEFKAENYEVINRHDRHFPHGFILQDFTPAYDLSYLLRKLPQSIDNKEYGYRWRWHLTPLGEGGHGYNISYQNNMWVTAHKSSLKRKGLEDEAIDQLTHWRPPHWSYEAVDVVAKLAIELFKQGILTRTGDA